MELIAESLTNSILVLHTLHINEPLFWLGMYKDTEIKVFYTKASTVENHFK